MSLPETEGLLFNTGYASSTEYTAYYPLLGPSRSRTVIPVHGDGTAESIAARMRRAKIGYAYVAAQPDKRRVVEALYDPMLFELVRMSTATQRESKRGRRFFYDAANKTEQETGTRRYLYHLK